MKTKFEQMGIAAMLPGMRYLLERMQAEITELEDTLNPPQGDKPSEATVQRKHPISTYWSKMTPEERSAEIKRRMKTRRKNMLAAAQKGVAA